MSDVNLDYLAKFSTNNRNDLEESVLCGCYYCRNVYDPKEIYEWIDAGETALCAKCGIDSVIAGKVIKLTDDLLLNMHKHWFCFVRKKNNGNK